MDPNENLDEQLSLAVQIQDCGEPDHEECDCLSNAERLAELVSALSEWIVRGGCLPSLWIK